MQYFDPTRSSKPQQSDIQQSHVTQSHEVEQSQDIDGAIHLTRELYEQTLNTSPTPSTPSNFTIRATEAGLEQFIRELVRTQDEKAERAFNERSSYHRKQLEKSLEWREYSGESIKRRLAEVGIEISDDVLQRAVTNRSTTEKNSDNLSRQATKLGLSSDAREHEISRELFIHKIIAPITSTVGERVKEAYRNDASLIDERGRITLGEIIPECARWSDYEIRFEFKVPRGASVESLLSLERPAHVLTECKPPASSWWGKLAQLIFGNSLTYHAPAVYGDPKSPAIKQLMDEVRKAGATPEVDFLQFGTTSGRPTNLKDGKLSDSMPVVCRIVVRSTTSKR